jgi:hypothetical protein
LKFACFSIVAECLIKATAASSLLTEPVRLNVVAVKLTIPFGTKSKSRSVEPFAVTASAIAAKSPETSVNLGVAPTDCLRLVLSISEFAKSSRVTMASGRNVPSANVSISRFLIAFTIVSFCA